MNEHSAGRSVDIENKAKSLFYLCATTDALRDKHVSWIPKVYKLQAIQNVKKWTDDSNYQTELFGELLELEHIIMHVSHFCLCSWRVVHSKTTMEAHNLRLKVLQNHKKCSNSNFREEIMSGTIMNVLVSFTWVYIWNSRIAHSRCILCIGHSTKRIATFQPSQILLKEFQDLHESFKF